MASRFVCAGDLIGLTHLLWVTGHLASVGLPRTVRSSGILDQIQLAYFSAGFFIGGPCCEAPLQRPGFDRPPADEMDRLWSIGRDNSFWTDLRIAGYWAYGPLSEWNLPCSFLRLFPSPLVTLLCVTGSWMWSRSPDAALHILFRVPCSWLYICCLCSCWEGPSSFSRLRLISWRFLSRRWQLRLFLRRCETQCKLDWIACFTGINSRIGPALGICPDAEFRNKPCTAFSQHSRTHFESFPDRQSRNFPHGSGSGSYFRLVYSLESDRRPLFSRSAARMS